MFTKVNKIGEKTEGEKMKIMTWKRNLRGHANDIQAAIKSRATKDRVSLFISCL